MLGPMPITFPSTFYGKKNFFNDYWPITGHFSPFFSTPQAPFEAIEHKMLCHIVNVNLTRPCIIATSEMAPGLSAPTTTLHTLTEKG